MVDEAWGYQWLKDFCVIAATIMNSVDLAAVA
jgi:hypothetical protein